MLTNVDASAAISLLWILLLTAVFLALRPGGPPAFARDGRRLLLPALLLTALLARLVPLILLPVGAEYDVQSFLLAGEALLRGQDVYTSAAIGRHPYLPMQMYWIGFALWLARQTGLAFVVFLKIAPVLADVVLTGLIFLAARRARMSDAAAATLALLYALNPISILVSAYHGQFDAVTLALLLASWYIWQWRRRPYLAALLLGFAILNKTWPAIFLPVFWLRLQNWRQRLIFPLIALAVPMLFTVGYVQLFDSDARPMLQRALAHSGVPGYWGLSAVFAVVDDAVPRLAFLTPLQLTLNRWLLLVFGAIAFWIQRRQSMLTIITTLILVVLAVNAGMGLQWLLWVVPFALLDRDLRWLRAYTLVSTAFLLLQYYGFHLYPWLYRILPPEGVDLALRLSSLPVWLTIVAWTATRLLKSEVPKSTTVEPV